MYVNDNRQGHHVRRDGHPSKFSTATERDREPLAHHRLPTQTLLVYIKGLPRSSLSIEHSANQAGPWLHLFIPTIHSLSSQTQLSFYNDVSQGDHHHCNSRGARVCSRFPKGPGLEHPSALPG